MRKLPNNVGSSNQANESPAPALATEAVEQKSLLPPIEQRLKGRKCLVLDLDETLVHSSFKVRFSSLFFPPVFLSSENQLFAQCYVFLC